MVSLFKRKPISKTSPRMIRSWGPHSKANFAPSLSFMDTLKSLATSNSLIQRWKAFRKKKCSTIHKLAKVDPRVTTSKVLTWNSEWIARVPAYCTVLEPLPAKVRAAEAPAWRASGATTASLIRQSRWCLSMLKDHNSLILAPSRTKVWVFIKRDDSKRLIWLRKWSVTSTLLRKPRWQDKRTVSRVSTRIRLKVAKSSPSE